MFHLLLTMSLFLLPTDPLLNQPSYEVCPCDIRSEEIQKEIDTLYEVACGKITLVGLAAPQIGIQKRIILVDTAATGIFTETTQPPPPVIKEFINPVIIWQSEEMVTWREGCFSTSCICGLVPRSNQILIRAYDRHCNIVTQEFSGYVARIFQHEIDHLDGIRFPDRITNDQHLHWVEESERPSYRIHWAHWEKLAPRQTWLEMKH
jgi:peptide deformylase